MPKPVTRTTTGRAPGSSRIGSPWGSRSLAAYGLVAVAVWIGRSSRPAPEPAAGIVPDVLSLLPTDAPPELRDWGPRFDRHLLDGLIDIEEMSVRRSAICEADAVAEQTYCLEPILLSITDAAELSVSLREARSARELYASPVTALATGQELDHAAEELSDLVGAYFDVIRDPYSRDPDLKPWFNLQRHDPRAIRDFLFGVRYVYRHDSGGRDGMALAMERDPAFIAPRVWRTPSITEAEAETQVAHRRELGRLYDSGGAFERAMVKWAQAVMDGDLAAQLRHLDVALEQEPGNRPAINARGLAHVQLAEFDEAWIAFDQLLKARWDFPGLYPLAAYCAVRRDRMDDLRRALDTALEFKTVDLNSLVLLRLLAIFDERTELEASLLARVETRRKQQPGGLDPDLVPFVAEYLASKAEAQDRERIAARLRESAR